MSTLDKIRKENLKLRQEITHLHESKIRMVIATSQEIERLRRFVYLLSNALRGKGITKKTIQDIEQNIINSNAYTKNSNFNSFKNNNQNKNKNKNKKPKKKAKVSIVRNDRGGHPLSLGHGAGNIKQTKTNTSSTINRQRDNIGDVRKVLNSINNDDKELKSLKKNSQQQEESLHRHTVSLASQRAHTPKDIMDETLFQFQPELIPIDETHESKPTKKTIHEASQSKSSVAQIEAQMEAETQPQLQLEQARPEPEPEPKVEAKPLSIKERMKALNSASEDTKQHSRVAKLKQERGMGNVKITASDRSAVGALFNNRIEKQKKQSTSAGKTSAKESVVKKALKNPEPEKAVDVIQSLGLFVAKEKAPDHRKKKPQNISQDNDNDNDNDNKEAEEEPKLEVLNMNNNTIMKTMTDKERENMRQIVCDSIVRNPDLTQVQMCNANVDATFFIKILDALASETAQNKEKPVTEIWMESNPIGDAGLQRLGTFLANDTKIQVVKLYNNKITAGTDVLNGLLDGLEQNTTVQKFVFDGFRFTDQKDRLSKYLRRNNDIARKKRNEERKRLEALKK